MAKNKKKKQRKVVAISTLPRDNRDLEYYMANFTETCDHKTCGLPLVVHAFRPKSHAKSMAVYAHCNNKGACPRAMMEICFIEKFV